MYIKVCIRIIILTVLILSIQLDDTTAVNEMKIEVCECVCVWGGGRVVRLKKVNAPCDAGHGCVV